MDEFSILNHRLDLLEEICMGAVMSKAETLHSTSISMRLEQLAIKYSSVENYLPSLKQCFDMMFQLKPLMQLRKDSMVEVLGRIDLITNNQGAIRKQIQSLSTIAHLSPSLDSEELHGLEPLQNRLTELECCLALLQREADAQRDELDQLLSVYECAADIASTACHQWEQRWKQQSSLRVEDTPHR